MIQADFTIECKTPTYE